MERHNVDLLATQLVHDLTHTGATRTNTRTDRIHVRVVRPHRDLGAVAWFTSTRLDFDDPVRDLRHLKLKQPLHQTRMGPAHHDLRTLRGLANLDDVGLDSRRAVGTLIGHLLRLRQERLDPTQIEQGVPGIGLLDHAGDNVALAAGVLLVLEIALGLTNALGHDLTSGLSCDPTEVVGRDLKLLPHRLALFVELLREHLELHGVGVDRDPGVLIRLRHPLIRMLKSIGERTKEGVHGDPSIGGERLQRIHHVLVHC